MRVHLIRKETIESYISVNARSRPSFNEFLQKLKHADWERPNDMKATFNTADLLGKGSNRVAFNVGGNAYRMICTYAFGARQVHLFIAWIGNHAEYSSLCSFQMQYTISNY